MKQAPTQAQWNQYDANAANLRNILTQPLYDYQAYPTTGATSMKFFQVPIGQSSKTEADTNMTVAGMLPAPQEFMVTGIEVRFIPGTDLSTYAAAAVDEYVNDVQSVLNSGYLKFNVGTSNYVTDGPIGAFPCSFRLNGFAALASDAASTGTSLSTIAYAAAVGEPYEIVPVKIPKNQNFDVTLHWPTAVTVTTAGTIGVRLKGFLNRAVQ